jgi:hypothetical protein
LEKLRSPALRQKAKDRCRSLKAQSCHDPGGIRCWRNLQQASDLSGWQYINVIGSLCWVRVNEIAQQRSNRFV